MLEREVDSNNLGVDVVVGIETVARLMPLHGDGVAIEVDGRHGHHLLAHL